MAPARGKGDRPRLFGGENVGRTVTSAIVALAIGPCADGRREHPAASAEHHWTYDGKDGPAHWGELSSDFQACRDGQMQSPIDLGAANVDADVAIELAYRPVPLTILHNGHTVQFNVANGSTLKSHGQTYSLVQVHFHAPGEHVIGTQTYPLEAHFVHKADDGTLAVLGLFFREGKANGQLAGLLKHLPEAPSAPVTYPDVTMDPRAMLPAAPALYRYMGSLTAPPCSEGVNWFVVRQPAEAAVAEIAALHAAMGDNARQVMPLNHRLVIEPR